MIATHKKNKPMKNAYQPIDLDFQLYLVTDRKVLPASKPLLKATEEALRGGVRAIQLREKDLGTRNLLRLAYEMRELTLRYDARLFINDRVDIAIAVDADGVHLGQKSIPPYAVRRLAARLIVGVSAHNLAEANKAVADGADFLTLGPVFPTPSKPGATATLGLEGFRAIASKVPVPVFGIGGIALDNLKDVMDHGAAGVSMISSIYAAKDIKAASLKLLKLLK
jgi:thiamine-phosphate pyrophosphorylase